MNRKATLLLIAAVATILPAVAVADVMITGQVSIVGTQNTPVFVIQPGPNYAKAHAAGAIDFIGDTQLGVATVDHQASSIGIIDLQGISNQTTYLINVIDLNITAGTGTLYLNLTDTSLPVGTTICITDSLMTFSDLMTYGVEIGSDVSVPINLATLSVTAGDTFYFGFYMPPGTYAGTSATVLGTFISS